MAIETNELIDVKTLSPFKRFIMTIGNLPTSYLESMTYGEMLMWFCNYLQETVIPTVNNNAEAVEELQNLYEELKNYVDHYFENLDVTDEINAKLDQLVLNGTLENLIGAYIQPRIDEQNQEINTFKNEINNEMNTLSSQVHGVASGSPLVASSTDGMTDTSRIYVNTTDGKWYYYDGDSWEIGGTYQTTGLGEHEISFNNLETELTNGLTTSTTLADGDVVLKKYINAAGTETSNNYTCYISIPVNYQDTYKIDIPYSTATFGTTAPVYMLRNNGSIVKTVTGGEVTLDDNTWSGIVDIPSGVDELIINAVYGYNVKCRLNVVKVNKYVPNNITKEQLDSKIQAIFTNTYTSVTPTLFVNNALLGPNDVAGINGYAVYSVDVNPGEIYKISGTQIYTNPFVAFGNANATITYTIGGNDYVFNCIQGSILGTSGQEYSNYIFTVPDNCNKLYIDQQTGHNVSLYKVTGYTIEPEDYTQYSPLDEKTILFAGDSVTAATTAGVKGWATLISENNPTATVYNYGVDGATLSINSSTGTNNIIAQLESMHSEHPTADYIIIQGGINDAWMPSTVPMGTFDPDTDFNNNPNYDKSTFCGALEYIFYYCLTNFGGKKVGFIVSPQMAGISNFDEYMEKAKQICNKWSIPYIDLFNAGGINFHNSYQRQNYSITTVTPTGDGTHPNLAGYQVLTPKIENWLKYNL